MQALEMDMARASSDGGRGLHGGVSIARIRHNPKVATAVIGFSFFSDYLLLLMMVPILPLYGTELGLSNTAIGVIFGMKPLAQMVANPIVGMACDRVGTRVPMVAALVFLSAATLLFAFAETYSLLVLARLLQGVSSSANVVAGMSHLSKLFSGQYSEQRGAMIGRAAVGISLGVMAGAPVGGVLFAAGGKRLPFLVVAGVLVFDALARVVLLAEPDEVHHALEQSQKEGGLALQDASQGGSALFREDVGAQERGTLQSGAGEANVEDGAHGTTRHRATSVVDPEGGGGAQDHTPAACDSDVEQGVDDEKKEKKAEDQRPALVVLKELCCDPQVVVITLVLLCGNGCIGFAEAQLPRYLEETFDLGSLTIGLIYGAQTMLFTIVMPILAARGAAIGRPFLMALGLVVMGACITLVPWWKNLVWVIPIWMGTAVGMACIDSSCNPQLADIVESRHPGSYGKAFALANTGTSLGFTLSPIVGGYIVDHSGFAVAALSISLVLLVYAPVVLVVFRAVCCCAGRVNHQRLEEEEEEGGEGEHGGRAPHNSTADPLVGAAHADDDDDALLTLTPGPLSVTTPGGPLKTDQSTHATGTAAEDVTMSRATPPAGTEPGSSASTGVVGVRSVDGVEERDVSVVMFAASSPDE